MSGAVEFSTAATRERALAILRRHGREPISFQTLARGLLYLFEGEHAYVAFADTGRAWVAAGPPVGSPAHCAKVMRRFVDEARRVGRRPRWFGIRAELAEQAGLAHRLIGQEPVWSPAEWETTLRRSRSLREQLRRARAKGVRVRVLSVAQLRQDEELRDRLGRIAARWLASKKMAPMGFLLQLDPFRFAEERLYLVAERDERTLELLVASPVHATGGWFVEHLLRDPDAPNGTSELLIDGLMRLLSERDCRYLTLGLAPLAGPVGRGLRLARRAGRVLYNFEGLHAFKAKLRPARWEPVHLAYPRGERGVRAVVDVLAAFATGGFVRFAGACIRHLWRPITWVLALLLVPWTLLLALASGAWFPSTAAQRAWVSFDCLLIGLMLLLLRLGRGIDLSSPSSMASAVAGRMRRWQALASVLFGLAGADVALTAVQAIAFNAPRAEGLGDWVVIGLSMLAPALATLFFGLLRARPGGAVQRTELQLG